MDWQQRRHPAGATDSSADPRAATTQPRCSKIDRGDRALFACLDRTSRASYICGETFTMAHPLAARPHRCSTRLQYELAVGVVAPCAAPGTLRCAPASHEMATNHRPFAFTPRARNAGLRFGLLGVLASVDAMTVLQWRIILFLAFGRMAIAVSRPRGSPRPPAPRPARSESIASWRWASYRVRAVVAGTGHIPPTMARYLGCCHLHFTLPRWCFKERLSARFWICARRFATVIDCLARA